MGSCLSSDQGQGWSYSPASQGGSPRWLRRNLTRKFGSRGPSSLDPKRDEMLQGIPGRMWVNGASPAVSLFTQQGKKGTNQDAMIFWENFGSREDTVFCGVFDGHGPLGHIVAREVRDALPLKLNDHWSMIAGQDDPTENGSKRSTDSEEMAVSPCLDEEPMPSTDCDEREQHPQMFDILKQSFQQAYRIMDKELRVHQHIDCFCSGTTAVTLVKQGQNLVIGNLGDSRAILGTRDENKCLNAVQLTVDLKPSLPREAERIRRCRGRVFALRDEPNVARVWLPNNDSPGLAMARAFGDFCLKDFGLISVPDISYRQLTERDEFIVLATDGIWDVLSNEEVVDIVASSPTRSSTARALVESAVRGWRCKYPTSKVDDCAVICLFLDTDQSKSVASFTDNKEPIDMLEGSCSENTETSSLIELKRSGTVRASCDVILDESEKNPRETIGSNSTAETTDAEDWSALEGVSRVNTLLTLPRFTAGGQKEAGKSKLKK